MGKALVIVESPAKARKIQEYLGGNYIVESSIGHIRDLPKSAAEVPEAYKNESWAKTGVDVENGFKPLYVESLDKKDQIRTLRKLVKQADEVFLATDEDREGEAIAWHLLEVLNPTVPVHRMVFHEITQDAIQAAVAAPRELDRKMVDAQEARRIMDRLYGYEVSPVLWKKVGANLSAGRVQSVATRVVVERERERMAFVPAAYWDVKGQFSGDDGETDREFTAALVSVDGQRLATGRDFDERGQLNREDAVVFGQAGAEALVASLEQATFTVRSRDAKPYRRRPPAPFTTSTFQQEAGNKLGLSAQMAMRTAQSLYEKGLITYMRTDSSSLSEVAIGAARAAIGARFGSSVLPDAPRQYATKAKNAQEAHEAIRPSGDRFRTPEDVASEPGHSKLEVSVYDLIWRRTLASQMTDCVGETVTLRLGTQSADGRDVEFSASGTVITHRGFREALDVERRADAGAETNEEADERRLPPLHEGDSARIVGSLQIEGHETQPPSRFTEASLVKQLEELGVGRPSTYASIIGTIQQRGYVWKKGSALIPSFTAFSVVTLMEGHFPNLVDYAFTARMEDDLDRIAAGLEEVEPWLGRFYFGEGPDGEPGLHEKVSTRLPDIDARAVNTIPLGVTGDGRPLVVRSGKFGPYVQLGDGANPEETETASIPDDIPPAELTIEMALEFLSIPKEGRIVGDDPATGLPIYAKAGRFGPYVQVGTHEDWEASGEKPPTASLFSTMTLERLTFNDALDLLSLPRTVGADPADGEPIVVQNGRYGPYLSKANDTRSLETEEQLLTITLDECLALLAQPKRRRGQKVSAPLRELGEDPVTGRPMVIKDGRFGPYITDGESNASLRTGDTVEEMTVERAAELLVIRRAKQGVKKKATKKKAAKKKATKKATKKKASTKKAAKKAGAKSMAEPSEPPQV